MFKNKKNTRYALLFVCVIFIVSTFLIYNFAIKDKPSNNSDGTQNATDSGLQILSITENDEWIDVETTYGKFHYPFAFSDIITVETFNEGTSSMLCFTAIIDGSSLNIFTIHYNNSNKGIACGTLKISKESVPVTVEFSDPPGNLSNDWLMTFNAAQETFNDVLMSMSENRKFSLVEQ